MPYETETVFSAPLFLFVIGLTTDTKAGSMNNELNSSVSANLKALTAGNPIVPFFCLIY
jgi:hypothetical protein